MLGNTPSIASRHKSINCWSGYSMHHQSINCWSRYTMYHQSINGWSGYTIHHQSIMCWSCYTIHHQSVSMTKVVTQYTISHQLLCTTYTIHHQPINLLNSHRLFDRSVLDSCPDCVTHAIILGCFQPVFCAERGAKTVSTSPTSSYIFIRSVSISHQPATQTSWLG